MILKTSGHSTHSLKPPALTSWRVAQLSWNAQEREQMFKSASYLEGYKSQSEKENRKLKHVQICSQSWLVYWTERRTWRGMSERKCQSLKIARKTGSKKSVKLACPLPAIETPPPLDHLCRLRRGQACDIPEKRNYPSVENPFQWAG